MEAGRKAAPSCHLAASMRSIMKSGSDGSSIPIPMLEKVIAPVAECSYMYSLNLAPFLKDQPEAHKMYGSLMRAFSVGASSSLLRTAGCRTSSWRPGISDERFVRLEV